MCLRAYTCIVRVLVFGFPFVRSSRVASLMAGERMGSVLLIVTGQRDPVIIFQGHVSGRVLVVAPVWERPGSVEGGPWVFCLVPTVGPFSSLVWESSSCGTRRPTAWHCAMRTSVSGSERPIHGTAFESRAVICSLALGVNSMFVRCLGQLAITVVLCGGPGSLPTRSATAQPCV